MNKLVTKILKESGVKAKITQDSKRPKFRVKNNQLTLEGVITNGKYTMKITDNHNNVIDELSVSVKDGNDVANRINESILTLNNLSPIYDKQVKLKEDEEFEDLPDAEPGDIQGAISALKNIYTNLMDIANTMKKVNDYYEDDDAEGKNQIISYVSAIYDLALDIDEYIDDTIEEMQEESDAQPSQKESVKTHNSVKSATVSAIEGITIAQSALHGHKELNNVTETLKDIKAELITRKNKF